MVELPKELIQEFYTALDKDVASFPKVCKKGCFACCYQPIELLSFERPALEDFIKNQMNEEQRLSIREKTAVWLDFFDKHTSDVEPLSATEAYHDFRYRAEHIPFPCPLLFDGKCGVYQARPLTCRIHFVNDDKQLCEKDRLRDSAKESVSYRNKVIQNLKVNEISLGVVPLTYALVEILKMDRKLKRIESISV